MSKSILDCHTHSENVFFQNSQIELNLEHDSLISTLSSSSFAI
jgi:hypothetical protein